MNYEFKGHAGKWYLQEYTDAYTSIVRCDDGHGFETIFLFSTPQTMGEKKRYDAKLASKSLQMFEMLKMVSDGINSMSFDQFELLNNDIEQLLKEATEL